MYLSSGTACGECFGQGSVSKVMLNCTTADCVDAMFSASPCTSTTNAAVFCGTSAKTQTKHEVYVNIFKEVVDVCL